MTPISLYDATPGKNSPLREVRTGDRAITVTADGLQVADQTFTRTVTGEAATTEIANLLALSARTGDPTVLVFKNGIVEVYPTSQLPVLRLE